MVRSSVSFASLAMRWSVERRSSCPPSSSTSLPTLAVASWAAIARPSTSPILLSSAVSSAISPLLVEIADRDGYPAIGERKPGLRISSGPLDGRGSSPPSSSLRCCSAPRRPSSPPASAAGGRSRATGCTGAARQPPGRGRSRSKAVLGVAVAAGVPGAAEAAAVLLGLFTLLLVSRSHAGAPGSRAGASGAGRGSAGARPCARRASPPRSRCCRSCPTPRSRPRPGSASAWASRSSASQRWRSRCSRWPARSASCGSRSPRRPRSRSTTRARSSVGASG